MRNRIEVHCQSLLIKMMIPSYQSQRKLDKSISCLIHSLTILMNPALGWIMSAFKTSNIIYFS